MPSVRHAWTFKEQVQIDFPCSRQKADASSRPRERVKLVGVQISWKSIANFAHHLDLDGHARVEDEVHHRSEPNSGWITEVVARVDISASEEKDADGKGQPAGASDSTHVTGWLARHQARRIA
eukprot:6214822-Pleurochrysis_carterae.AAC.7